jgi:hypothetical protein
MSDIIPYPIVQRIIDDTYMLKCAEAFSDDSLNILNLAS